MGILKSGTLAWSIFFSRQCCIFSKRIHTITRLVVEIVTLFRIWRSSLNSDRFLNFSTISFSCSLRSSKSMLVSLLAEMYCVNTLRRVYGIVFHLSAYVIKIRHMNNSWLYMTVYLPPPKKKCGKLRFTKLKVSTSFMTKVVEKTKSYWMLHILTKNCGRWLFLKNNHMFLTKHYMVLVTSKHFVIKVAGTYENKYSFQRVAETVTESTGYCYYWFGKLQKLPLKVTERCLKWEKNSSDVASSPLTLFAEYTIRLFCSVLVQRFDLCVKWLIVPRRTAALTRYPTCSPTHQRAFSPNSQSIFTRSVILTNGSHVLHTVRYALGFDLRAEWLAVLRRTWPLICV